ncbi:GFA family protein [Pseudomonas sp. X10]
MCHTRLFNTTSAAPGLLVLRAGTLMQAADLVPAAHIWTRSKQAWMPLPDGIPSWPQSPTPEQFATALSKR